LTTPAHVEWAAGEALLISPLPWGEGGSVGEGWLADTRIRCKHVCSLVRRGADWETEINNIIVKNLEISFCKIFEAPLGVHDYSLAPIIHWEYF
jgi:hypothetical protein